MAFFSFHGVRDQDGSRLGHAQCCADQVWRTCTVGGHVQQDYAGAGRIYGEQNESVDSYDVHVLPPLNAIKGRARGTGRRQQSGSLLSRYGPVASIQDKSEAQVKQANTKMMSLPCTVVSSANGSLEVLNLKCAPSSCMPPLARSALV